MGKSSANKDVNTAVPLPLLATRAEDMKTKQTEKSYRAIQRNTHVKISSVSLLITTRFI